MTTLNIRYACLLLNLVQFHSHLNLIQKFTNTISFDCFDFDFCFVVDRYFEMVGISHANELGEYILYRIELLLDIDHFLAYFRQ